LFYSLSPRHDAHFTCIICHEPNILVSFGTIEKHLDLAILTKADLSIAHAVFLLATNAIVAMSVLAAAAIDLEHMILPNTLTLGVAALCVLTSPLRSVGVIGSLAGAIVGLVLAYLPFALLKRLRGESSMGLGDAKLAIMAMGLARPLPAMSGAEPCTGS